MALEKPATKSGDNPDRSGGHRPGQSAAHPQSPGTASRWRGSAANWLAAQGGAIGDAVESDELGIATAVWTLGPEEGTQVTTATVEGATNSPLTYSATAESGEPPPPPPGVTVDVQADNTFSPTSVTIAPGQSVTWEWAEGSGRTTSRPTLKSRRPAGFCRMAPLPTPIVHDAGTYAYYCTAHGAPVASA